MAIKNVKNRIDASKLIVAINIKDEQPEIIGVCTSGTGGVKSATYSLVPNIFEVPKIESQLEADIIAEEIIKYNPNKIIISGYPQGYDLLVKSINKKKSTIRIFFISHAPFTWYHGRPWEVEWLKLMFEAYEEGCIEKIGFVKNDVATYFKEKGVNAYLIMNRLPKIGSMGHELNKANLQIGVWGSDMWHRNILNQAVSALMVEKSMVHLNELPDYFFLDKSRIKRYGILPKDEFMPLLGSMDINLYVSFTDCFPMLAIESLLCGVPCIVSDTSEIYSENNYLRNMLTESKIDSPIAIKNRIELVVNNYDKVKKEIANHIPLLEKKIEKTIVEFLR